jgi:hypothetical protein
MPKRLIAVLRSIAAIVGGYLIVASGTIGAGLAGGMFAGLIAPKFPFMHAAGVLILIAIDTASVLAKGPGPIWFDLAGSTILAIAALIGGWIISQRAGFSSVEAGVPPANI